MDWADCRREVQARLSSAAEARWLSEHVSGWAGAQWWVHCREKPDAASLTRLFELTERRRAGEPIQYVLGAWQFGGIELSVAPGALIPRPETEVLADRAVVEWHRLKGGDSGLLVDAGTGSGAIALFLADALPGAWVAALDRSDKALAIADANRRRLISAGRVALVRSDWLSAIRGPVDIVVANPPYLARAELQDLKAEVAQHEPIEALVAGDTGTEDLVAIIGQAECVLRRPGVLLLEMAPGQAAAVRLAGRSRGAGEVEILPDLAGRARVAVMRWR